MRRFASYALLAAIALAAGGCAGSHAHVSVSGGSPVGLVREVDTGNRIGPGPFVPAGGWTGGGASGLWGDGGSGPRGTSLGCLENRHYSYAFGVENRTKAPVTFTAALGSTPAPGIVEHVATQLRLSPPQRPRPRIPNWGGNGIDLVYHGWSAAPLKPVTIPPHRIATIQANFLFHNCDRLAHGRSVTVPGSLVLDYRRSGHAGRQKIALPENRFVVGVGPTKRACAPVEGAGSLVAADVSCAFARHAAPLCRPMQNEGWLGCTVDGRFWDCGRFAGPGFPLLETCYLPHQKAHWFSVVWIGHGLGIWGAIHDRRANLGWNRIDAWPITRGTCQVRHDLRTLVFRSSALRMLRGKADARVVFVLRNYYGVGRYMANGSRPIGGAPVVVELGRRGAAKTFYLATAGRVTILRARSGSISGTVYASLRERGGAKRANLNGSWSCRTTVG